MTNKKAVRALDGRGLFPIVTSVPSARPRESPWTWTWSLSPLGERSGFSCF